MTDEHCCSYAFSTVAWKRMQNSVINYVRYISAPKRSADIVSLSASVDPSSSLTWEDVLTEKDSDLLQYETDELLRQMENELPSREMRLIRMKLDGCKMHDIAKREHLTFSEINKLLSDCREDIVRILYGDADQTAA